MWIGKKNYCFWFWFCLTSERKSVRDRHYHPGPDTLYWLTVSLLLNSFFGDALHHKAYQSTQIHKYVRLVVSRPLSGADQRRLPATR